MEALKKKLEEAREELEVIPAPTGYQLVALGAIRTALDNLAWHQEHARAAGLQPASPHRELQTPGTQPAKPKAAK